MIPTDKQLIQMMGGGTAPRGSDRARIATVTRMVSGRPYIRFDGEADESPTRYPVATGLSFAVGNRVLLLPVGGAYVIVARITP